MIALVDCSAFYASCEKIFRPDLRNRPVIVLSNNDFCIVALSAEAKKLGLKRCDSLKDKEQFLEDNGVAVFSSNYALYADISNRVMTLLRDFSPDVEVYSIDEAFLSLNHMHIDDFAAYGHTIHQNITSMVGIPMTVGIAPTKTLAKIAQEKAKHAGGVYIIPENTDLKPLLSTVPVGDIWGVGRQYAEALQKNNILTAWDLSQADEFWVKKRLTIQGWRTLQELKGTPRIGMETEIEGKQVIATQKLFGVPVTEYADLEEVIADYCGTVVRKLRKQQSVCHVVSAYLETSRFRQDFKSTYFSVSFSSPTAYLPRIITAAKKALKHAFIKGLKYKRAGIVLYGVEPALGQQLNFFYAEDPRRLALMDTIDRLNGKLGKKTLFPAAQGNGNQDWQTVRAKLSPCYTTKWEEIPTAWGR